MFRREGDLHKYEKTHALPRNNTPVPMKDFRSYEEYYSIENRMKRENTVP
jgi:hypothetical protein